VTALAPAELREGSEAIADAMVAAGCRFFSGYPMTPFT
jgi:2-oxoglutarate ferredoxin oxidoreductase subunit alpha